MKIYLLSGGFFLFGFVTCFLLLLPKEEMEVSSRGNSVSLYLAEGWSIKTVHPIFKSDGQTYYRTILQRSRLWGKVSGGSPTSPPSASSTAPKTAPN